MGRTRAHALDRPRHREHAYWSSPSLHSSSPRITQGFFFVGAGMVLTFQGMQIYVIDAFSIYAASGQSIPFGSHHSQVTHQSNCPALAAVSFLRSIAGFGFPLFAPAMYNALGYGVGNTMLAAIAFVIGVPAYVPAPRSVSGTVSSSHSPSRSVHRVLCFWKYGKKIRSMSRHAKVK